MSNTNQHILDYLKHYLKEGSHPDFAVMIRGSWGSGKTYFIRNNLCYEDCFEHTDSFSNQVLCYTLYVSMFGVKTREDIDSRIVETIQSYCKNEKIVKEVTSALIYVSGIVNEICGVPNAGLIQKAAKKATSAFVERYFGKSKEKILKNLVLVFDDLERSKMMLPELLGYINEYVEHLHIPCILLADTEKWEQIIKENVPEKDCQKTLDSLNITLEKVVGKKFEIQTTIDDVLNSWFSKADKDLQVSNDAKKIFTTNKEVMKDLFAHFQEKKSPLKEDIYESHSRDENDQKDADQIQEYINKIPERNFRCLKYTLKDFDYLCFYYCKELGNLLLSKQAQKNSFDDSFFKYFLYERYGEYLGLYSINSYNQGRKFSLDSHQKFTSWDLFTRVIGDYEQIPAFPMREWILRSAFDQEKVLSDLKNSTWFGKYTDYALGRLSYPAFIQSNKDFQKYYTEFKRVIKNGVISSPTTFLTLLIGLYQWSEKGLLEIDSKDLLDKFNNYLKKFGEKFVAEEIPNDNQLYRNYGEGFKDSYKEYEPFIKRVKKILSQKQKSALKKKENHFYELWKNDKYSDKFQLEYTLRMDRDYPVTRFNVVRMMREYMQMDPRTEETFNSGFQERYSILDNLNIAEEKEFLKALHAEAKIHLEKNKGKLYASRIRLIWLIKIIEDVQKRIDKH